MKILVIQTAFIGDVILITPLVRAIKESFPEASIDLIVVPKSSEVLQNNPNINSIIIFDKKKNKLFSFFKILNIIKKKKYDIAFLPHSSLTSTILTFLGRIPIRVGFDRWISRKLLTHKVTHIKNVFKIEKYLHLLSPFSKERFGIQTELFPTSKMENTVEKLLSELNTNKKIALAPGSIWYTKRWPEENYRKLIGYLSELNYGIILIGSKDEEELCDRLNPKINSLNLAGKLSILESASIIKNCDLMICNDSGALHIANAMQTEVIAFFGPTVKRIGYFPIGKNDKVMEIDLECRPCSSHGGQTCPLGHHNCMKLITPEIAFEEIKNHLRN